MSRVLTTVLTIVLAPLAAMCQHPPDSPEGPPVRVVAITHLPGHIAGGPQAPFGYFQTHWRSFPMPEAVLPKPAPATTNTAPVLKMPEKAIEPPMAPAIRPASSTTRGRFATQADNVFRRTGTPVPVPHPASMTGIAAATNSRGFATLRPEPMRMETQPAALPAKVLAPPPAPVPVPTAKQPVSEPVVRQVRGADDVVRPEWPKLPPVKK